MRNYDSGKLLRKKNPFPLKTYVEKPFFSINDIPMIICMSYAFNLNKIDR